MKTFYKLQHTHNKLLQVSILLLLTLFSISPTKSQTCDDPGGGYRDIDLPSAISISPINYFPGTATLPNIGRSTAGYIKFERSSASAWSNRTIVINPILNGIEGSVVLKYDFFNYPSC